MQFAAGILALIFNLVGYVPYIRDILRKKVKPHRITWGVWTILTAIAAFNQIFNQGGYSSLFFVSTALLVVTVFILSFRFGMGGASVVDRLCLVLALVLLVYWLTLKEIRVSTMFAVIIDGIGAIPTLLKTYRDPKTETYIQWSLAAVAGALTLLAIPRYDWALIIYPAYVILMNGAIVGTKFFRERSS